MNKIYTVKVAVKGFVYVVVDAESPQQAIDRAVEEMDKRTHSVPTDDLEFLPGESSAEAEPA